MDVGAGSWAAEREAFLRAQRQTNARVESARNKYKPNLSTSFAAQIALAVSAAQHERGSIASKTLHARKLRGSPARQRQDEEKDGKAVVCVRTNAGQRRQHLARVGSSPSRASAAVATDAAAIAASRVQARNRRNSPRETSHDEREALVISGRESAVNLASGLRPLPTPGAGSSPALSRGSHRAKEGAAGTRHRAYESARLQQEVRDTSCFRCGCLAAPTTARTAGPKSSASQQLRSICADVVCWACGMQVRALVKKHSHLHLQRTEKHLGAAEWRCSNKSPTRSAKAARNAQSPRGMIEEGAATVYDRLAVRCIPRDISVLQQHVCVLLFASRRTEMADTTIALVEHPHSLPNTTMLATRARQVIDDDNGDPLPSYGVLRWMSRGYPLHDLRAVAASRGRPRRHHDRRSGPICRDRSLRRRGNSVCC